MKSSLELMRSGVWAHGITDEIGAALMKAEEMCFDFNSLRPSMTAERHAIINRLFGSIEEPYVLHSPFHCDFGSQIHIGHHFIGNYNLTILDEGPVTIGNNVFIGPNSGIYTITHALDPQQRNEGIMRSLPVTIGNNVWIGAGVTILPGVTIGDNSVIGAGSVVTRSIPEWTLAAGNPCRTLRRITPADKITCKF